MSGWCSIVLVQVSLLYRGLDLGRILQPSEFRIYGFLGRVDGDPQGVVEIAGTLQLPVGFVDRINEVGDDDQRVDDLSVFYEFGRAGLRTRIAGANEERVQKGLDVRDNLWGPGI